jgi:hypothetical protein
MLLDAEEFVRKWTAADSLSSFVSSTGMSKQSAMNRAMRFRKRGVKLKRFPTAPPKGAATLDVNRLNAVIASL